MGYGGRSGQRNVTSTLAQSPPNSPSDRGNTNAAVTGSNELPQGDSLRELEAELDEEGGQPARTSGDRGMEPYAFTAYVRDEFYARNNFGRCLNTFIRY